MTQRNFAPGTQREAGRHQQPEGWANNWGGAGDAGFPLPGARLYLAAVVAQFPGMMRLPRFLFSALLGLGLGGSTSWSAQAPNPTEVFELLRTNLPGITDAQLQVAAVEGLVKELAPRVWLAGAGRTDRDATDAGPALLKSEVLPGPALYLRLGRVSAGLSAEVESAFTELSATNQFKGLVVDLRYANGTDYAAAGEAADLAVGKEQLLLDWGTGRARSTAKSDVPELPIVVLVNQQTAGAAEALAGVLRDAGVAILIGTNTAGRAMMTEEFPLSNGQRLCIARKGIKLGSGEELTSTGLRPDIVVKVAPADEKAWWADPFRDLSAPSGAGTDSGSAASVTGTNRPPRRRVNEAELVRARREGTNLNAVTGAVVEEDAAVVRDPALARALDLLKALAVVKEWKAK